MFDLLVRNGNIVSKGDVFRGDVLVRDGKIAALTTPNSGLEAKTIVDASGMMVLPGLIDAHSHAGHGDPDRESFAAYSQACAAGGITTFIDMPLSNPSTLTVERLKDKIATSGKQSFVDYALYGGVVPGYLEHVEPMFKEGAQVFKCFTCRCSNYPMTDDGTLIEGMRIVGELGGLISVHAENDTLIQSLVDKLQGEGKDGPRAFLDSHPVYSELEAIWRVFFLAKYAPECKVHIAHMSVPEGMDALRRCRAEGQLNLSAETCPQYLGLNEDDLISIGSLAKCDPPVRSRESVERVWEHVINGTIDIIASDHSPHPFARKTEAASFWKVAEGCTGVQTMLPVVMTEGMKRGLKWERLVELMGERVAELFGLKGRKGALSAGYDADIVIVDPEKKWTLKNDDLFHLVKQSPFTGREFKGKVVRTFVRGELVFDDSAMEKIVGKQGYGKFCPMNMK